jgi:DNA-binding GntR family transcriptional regulator
MASDTQEPTIDGKWSAVQNDRKFVTGGGAVRSREVAYAAIKDAILRGLLEPRERLIEERLGKVLGLSRTPIREALAILEHEGLIEAIPYKGLVVRPVTVQEFLGMYEALGPIESAIARAAVLHMTEAAAQELGAILDAAEAAIPDDVAGHLAKCREFQRRLGECAQRPFLTQMLLGIEERSDVYLLHSGQHLPEENMRAAVSDRRNILAAVRRADAAAAAAAAEAHADGIRHRWRGLYPDESAAMA